jgi:hypothetical protein
MPAVTKSEDSVGLNKLTLKTKLIVLASLFVTGMAVFALVAFMALSELKIGGSLYSQIRTGVDIGSDFEPAAGHLMGVRLHILEASLDAKDPALLRGDIQQVEEAQKVF